MKGRKVATTREAARIVAEFEASVRPFELKYRQQYLSPRWMDRNSFSNRGPPERYPHRRTDWNTRESGSGESKYSSGGNPSNTSSNNSGHKTNQSQTKTHYPSHSCSKPYDSGNNYQQ